MQATFRKSGREGNKLVAKDLIRNQILKVLSNAKMRNLMGKMLSVKVLKSL